MAFFMQKTLPASQLSFNIFFWCQVLFRAVIGTQSSLFKMHQILGINFGGVVEKKLNCLILILTMSTPNSGS